MAKTRYTLHYFDTRGRAEPIRLLLSHVGADWEDHGIQRQDWPAAKPGMPLGQAPVLVEHRDGVDVKIPQSQAILRHLARVHGADGKTEDERLAADIVAETALELAGAFSRLRFSPAWQDAEAKAKYAAETVPVHLARLETVLGDRSWATGAGPTYADLVVFDVLDGHLAHWPRCLSDHAKLVGWVDRVRALPSLQGYLPKRRPAG